MLKANNVPSVFSLAGLFASFFFFFFAVVCFMGMCVASEDFGSPARLLTAAKQKR